jgi:hypothetical protein
MVRTLGGIASVTNVSSLIENGGSLAQIARTFRQGEADLDARIKKTIKRVLPDVLRLLEIWKDSVFLAQMEVKDSNLKRLYYRGRFDYELGRYHTLAQLGCTDALIELFPKLTRLARHFGEFDILRRLEEGFVGLAEAQGASQEIAQALFEEGRNLFYGGSHAEARNKLSQALIISEHIGDDELAQKCELVLEWIQQFFIRDKGPIAFKREAG